MLPFRTDSRESRQFSARSLIQCIFLVLLAFVTYRRNVSLPSPIPQTSDAIFSEMNVRDQLKEFSNKLRIDTLFY